MCRVLTLPPLWETLFLEALDIQDGYAILPREPVLGLKLNLDFISDHRVG